MKRLIMCAIALQLSGCTSTALFDGYDKQAMQTQYYEVQKMEEADRQLAANDAEREVREAYESKINAEMEQRDRELQEKIAKQEAASFSHDLGNGLGLLSKCADTRYSNHVVYNWFKAQAIAGGKENPNYNAAKVQAGFESGVQLGVIMMHSQPFAFIQRCNQMNAAYNMAHSAGHSKVSDFQ
ncbi:hypothetical protein phiAS5_ORF0225 [Aeromonas phage phiAS5]|uniref:Uncharacterized protein n=1 Tax=Aeromonas phage phiAS5 TaxID=879630 RepID=E1A1X9_9CAUD|nr:hypothetical protein phiAS5_ORF0225 [Aeromonas phage phiAS5]ADM80068.1 hypothetical protein phiAS5_ORF0225 [Aeromonas phage phiAS5]BES53166.1 hypothetical protein [Aeromonas phage phiWae14]